MAQFYTLEEAARVLGMSPEELKSKAQHREIRAFLDGGSWRFRVIDIDELARRRGLGSDAELRLSDLEVPAAAGGENLDDLDLSEFQLGTAKPDVANETMDLSALKSPSGERPVGESSGEQDILFDDLSVPPGPVTGSSSVIIGMQSSGKLPSDSDVRLVPDNVNVKGSSDSDVRLASPDPDLKQPSDSDVTLIKDDSRRSPLPHAGFLRFRRDGCAVQPAGRLFGRDVGRRVGQRFRARAQSLQRSRRCVAAGIGQRFRAQRPGHQRRV